MDDKMHYQKTFRKKSATKEQYGKKLQHGRVDTSVSEDEIKAERRKVLKGRAESEEALGVKAQMKAEANRIKALQAAEGAARVGTAVISATADNGSGVKGVCTVTVSLQQNEQNQ